MEPLKSIHHINFIVENLEEAMGKYQAFLGLGPFEVENLPERGARTARLNLGGTWLVVVSPTRPDSVPGRFLASQGEGFFLLSFGVSDLNSALGYYERKGLLSEGAGIRNGLMDWRVVDLQTENLLGSKFHLTELGN